MDGFNQEKAAAAGEASARLGRSQALLARIFADGDIFYMGHEGGFPAEEVVRVAESFDRLPGAHFARNHHLPGATIRRRRPAGEGHAELKDFGKGRSGFARGRAQGDRDQCTGHHFNRGDGNARRCGRNAGGTRSRIDRYDPFHAVRDLPELPAVLYLSEIAHLHQGKPYCFGGGLYIDPVFPEYDVRAWVGKDGQEAMRNAISVKIPPANAIDYYGILQPERAGQARVGDTVIFGFRIQAFVTRAFVVPVSGVAQGKPVVEGVSADGRRTNWPAW